MSAERDSRIVQALKAAGEGTSRDEMRGRWSNSWPDSDGHGYSPEEHCCLRTNGNLGEPGCRRISHGREA